jgi:hypothetical protein
VRCRRMLVAAAHKSRSVLLAACLVDSVQFCSDGGSIFREVASEKKKKRCPKARLFTKIGAKLGAWCYIVLLVA